MIGQVIGHTPLWVWLVLGYLIWQGIQALRPRTQPVWRALIVPAVFIVSGLSRIALVRGDAAAPLIAWLVAVLVFLPLALARGPRLLAVDRTSGQVTRPGSAVPLIRNCVVFVLQYAAAVMAARHVDDGGVTALVGRAISGGTAGYFIGWATAFLLAYRRAPVAA